ncbi:hypothetical protein N7501_000561 [Penicillium viridicatum]|nr:hypothetical protein N7501_000561 [Penicillium viridicatum]
MSHSGVLRLFLFTLCSHLLYTPWLSLLLLHQAAYRALICLAICYQARDIPDQCPSGFPEESGWDQLENHKL